MINFQGRCATLYKMTNICFGRWFLNMFRVSFACMVFAKLFSLTFFYMMGRRRHGGLQNAAQLQNGSKTCRDMERTTPDHTCRRFRQGYCGFLSARPLVASFLKGDPRHIHEIRPCQVQRFPKKGLAVRAVRPAPQAGKRGRVISTATKYMS